MTEGATRRAIEAVWRIETARLIGGLVRMVRNLDLAEDLAQDALVTALSRLPETGIPDNPDAWLMAAAKNRAVDRFRRHRMAERKQEALAWEGAGEAPSVPNIEAAIDENVGDDVLRLIIIACHSVLPADARTVATANSSSRSSGNPI